MAHFGNNLLLSELVAFEDSVMNPEDHDGLTTPSSDCHANAKLKNFARGKYLYNYVIP